MEMKNDGGRGEGFSPRADAQRQKVDTLLATKNRAKRAGLIP